jgi:hypothetical protein
MTITLNDSQAFAQERMSEAIANPINSVTDSRRSWTLRSQMLPETLARAGKVVSRQAEPEDIIDPWNRRLKQYSLGRLAITTRQ